jgi:hypothetical protein
MVTIDGSLLLGIAAILSSLGSLWRIARTAPVCSTCACFACSRQLQPLGRYPDRAGKGERHARIRQIAIGVRSGGDAGSIFARQCPSADRQRDRSRWGFPGGRQSACTPVRDRCTGTFLQSERPASWLSLKRNQKRSLDRGRCPVPRAPSLWFRPPDLPMPYGDLEEPAQQEWSWSARRPDKLHRSPA